MLPTRAFTKQLCLCGALAALLACDDAPTSASPAASVVDASVVVEAPPVKVPVVPQIYLDLVRQADRGHLDRGGPCVIPGGPGWTRVTQLADRGPWRPARLVDGKPLAMLDSIGATLHVPVGEGGRDLRDLVVWLKPIARGQRVSVFVDEAPVATVLLKPGLHRYRLPLPHDGLAPGEHSLRFWFRFTRWRGKKRTPGWMGPARFVPAGEPPALPETWRGEFEGAGVAGPALYAGPPIAWQFHIVPPGGGRLFTRAVVAEGAPVDFVVRVSADDQPTRELRRITVQPGTSAPLDVHLDEFAGQPVRLSLITEGAGRALQQAAWVEPQILRPGLPRSEVPPVRNVVLWVVDGLRADRVGLGRGGDRAATPNLDLLAREGAAAVDVWSGGASAADGHRRLLAPQSEGPSLPVLMANTGRRTGILSASTAIDAELTEQFHSRMDLIRVGDPAESAIVLRELDAWLDVRRRKPFFLYIATADPRGPYEAPSGFEAGYKRARQPRPGEDDELSRVWREEGAAYDAHVSEADYWIGQLMALLEVHEVRDDTLVIIAGSVGHEPGARGTGDGHALNPSLLQVPVVVWHPGLRNRGRPRRVVGGGDLSDVGATALFLAGAEPPDAWPGVEIATALFNELPIPAHASHARLGNQVAARFGSWLLRGIGARDLRLWNLEDDPTARVEISADRPIALRTLRDSMQDDR